jgi:hypothetical protein
LLTDGLDRNALSKSVSEGSVSRARCCSRSWRSYLVAFEPQEVAFSLNILCPFTIVQDADPECRGLGWLIRTKSLRFIVKYPVTVQYVE